MNINIDLLKISKRGLNVNQYLLLLKIYYRTKGKSFNFKETKVDYLYLRDNGFLVLEGNNVQLKGKAVNLIEGNTKRDYETLASKVREIFPKGAKSGRYPWRASVKDLTTKLKKLDKHYDMSVYSDDVIIKTAESYVNRFTLQDMDSGMQICKYFLEKDNSSSLMDLLAMTEEEPDKKESKSTITKL